MSIIVDKKLILSKIKKEYGYSSDTSFASFLGIKPTSLSSWYARNTFDIELLYSKCVGIDPDFLLTGSGSVKRDFNNLIAEPSDVYKIKTDKNENNQLVPLYNVEAAAGIVTLFNDTSGTKPIDYIKIPNLPKCDGAVYVTGDSMYPLLKSGDIIMYKQIHNIKDNIFWGEMYLISINQDGDELVLVKFVQKSDKGERWIKLVSQNKHHDDLDVDLKKVKALALIKASIRINSMS